MRLLAHVCFTIFFISLPFLSAFSQEFSKVRIWAENVTMPTYLVDPPDPNPRFYEGLACQGAQGRVDPYPIYKSLSHTLVEKE
jgi:hypothetical protein